MIDRRTTFLTWVQRSLHGRPLDALLRGMDFLPAFLRETADETVFYSYLYTFILWMESLENDLEILLAEIERPLPPEACRDTLARMRRCVEVDRLLVLQGELMQTALLRPDVDMHFHLLPRRARALRSFSRVGILTLHLESLLMHLDPSKWGDNAGELWRLAQEATHGHQNCLQIIHHQLGELISEMSAISSPRGVAFDELVPDNLPSYVELATGFRYEPGREVSSCVEDDRSRGFIILQSMAIWFSALESAYQQAIHVLQSCPVHIRKARHLIYRMAAILRLLTYMLGMPYREAFPAGKQQTSQVAQFDPFVTLLNEGVRGQPSCREGKGFPWDTSLLRTCVEAVLANRKVCLLSEVRRFGRQECQRTSRDRSQQVREEELATLTEAIQEFDSSERRWWRAAEQLSTMGA